MVREHMRLSLCKQRSDAADSEDEREIPGQAGDAPAFGSVNSDTLNPDEQQPSAANLSGAAAAAAGNSLPGKCYSVAGPVQPLCCLRTLRLCGTANTCGS